MIAGLYKTYQEYLMSDIWISKREHLLSIVEECEECGKKDRLEVHHKTYENIGHERRRDLQVLCKKCHETKYVKKEGKNGNKKRDIYTDEKEREET